LQYFEVSKWPTPKKVPARSRDIKRFAILAEFKRCGAVFDIDIAEDLLRAAIIGMRRKANGSGIGRRIFHQLAGVCRLHLLRPEFVLALQFVSVFRHRHHLKKSVLDTQTKHIEEKKGHG
jgi:hypothetical protein